MENYSYSSYPDSGNSSPRSREIDCENASWDEQPSNYKVKFMCSYGGKIHPRPHDNKLTYVGGDTKILSVDRNIRFSGFISKLSSLCDAEVFFKYQLPGEDLDALISVTNDEDLEHMMLEYDRVYRASARPVRLRLFLFPLNPPTSSNFGSDETKSERRWFVDALNSAQIQNPDDSSSPAAVASATNPDFLFGFDKGHFPPAKLQDTPPQPPQTVPEMFSTEIHAGSDYGSEDPRVIGEHQISPTEIQRQIQEMQRLQISNREQAMYHSKVEDTNSRFYSGEYYGQRAPEEAPPGQQTMPVTIPGPYWPEKPMTGGSYPMAAVGNEPPVYLISTPAGVYHPPTPRPVTGQVGQAFYGMQRMAPEVYRDQPTYNTVPPPSIQQPKFGVYSEPIGMVRKFAGGAAGVTEPGYAQVSYDGAGRQVFYTAPGSIVPPYQPVSAVVDARQGHGALNQEGKVVTIAKGNSNSSA